MHRNPGREAKSRPLLNTQARRVLLLTGALWLCWALPALGQIAPLPPDAAARQAAAVELARAGRHSDALAELARLRATYPDSMSLLYDEIVVLGWAERDELVRSRAGLLDAGAAPRHVQVAVAKSLRNLRRFDEAVDWYSRAVRNEPSDVDARLGLSLAYADAGKTDRALATLAPLRGLGEQRIAVGLAEAYAHEQAGQRLPALSAYDDVLALDSGHRGALRGKALVLRRVLLPTQALAIAKSHPGVLTDAEVARLRADEIALEIRYGTQVPYPPSQEHAMSDRAIAALDAYLAAGVADAQTELALRSDRIIALAQRGSSAEAIEAFEQLDSEHAQLPAPVWAAAGKAYLDARVPERALIVLEHAAALDPVNIDIKFALFYAHGELGELDAALALAERLAAELPLTLGAPGSPSSQPNPDRLRAEILVALALAYADRLDEAQAHLERWLADAPNNPDLRHELANIYRWRGWPDRSLFEYRQVLTVEPDLVEARVGRAHTQLDRAEFDVVEAAVEALNHDHAQDDSVERLTTLWTVHNLSELRIDTTAQDSAGVTFGSRQHSSTLTWLSAPMDNRYRAFVSSRDSYAEFPEGDSRRRRLAAGLQYRYGRWLASGEVSGDRGGGELGARAGVEYRLSDFLVLSSAVETQSDAVPLRGFRIGVDSDLLRLGARYAPHEGLRLELGAELEELSDGNGRAQLSAQGRRRLFDGSKLAVELTGEAFIGDRRRDDVPYFSPLRDSGALLGIETQWRVLRRYERRLTHILRVEIGSYDQSGYPSGTIGRIAYMMPFELSSTLSTWVGVWRNRMLYDGAEEYSTTASMSLQVRF